MNMRKRRLHEARPRDAWDRRLLGTAFGSGVLCIIVLKSLHIGAFWSALCSAGVLIAYAVVAYRHKLATLEPESIGDNCYYLGFLFTLTSLAVTLYQLAEAGRENDVLRDVIAGFGVALSSTIVGVFLRILMMQLRTDVVSRERQTKLELNESAREFRLRLTESISQIKDFSTESVQLAIETNSRIHASNEAFHEAQREQLAKSGEIYQQALSEVLKASSGQMAQDLGESIRKIMEQLRIEIAAGMSNLRQVVAETVKLQQSEIAAQRLRMKQVADEAKHSDDLMRRWGYEVQQITADIGQSMEKIQIVSKNLSACFEVAAEDIEVSLQKTRRAINLQRLDKAFDKPIAGLHAAAASLEQLVNEISTAVSKISFSATEESGKIKTDAALLTARLNNAAEKTELTIKSLADAVSSVGERALSSLDSNAFSRPEGTPASVASVQNTVRRSSNTALLTTLPETDRVEPLVSDPYAWKNEGKVDVYGAGPDETQTPQFPPVGKG